MTTNEDILRNYELLLYFLTHPKKLGGFTGELGSIEVRCGHRKGGIKEHNCRPPPMSAHVQEYILWYIHTAKGICLRGGMKILWYVKSPHQIALGP